MHKIAERILRKLGGPRNVAQMLGTSPQAIYKWTYPREYGGTGGLIPHRRQLELMIVAKQRGIVLTPEDFFPRVPHAKDQSSAESRPDV